MVARYGRLDVLVNNAGHTQVGAAEETTEQELRDLFEVHFHGPVALTVAALPHFRRAAQRRRGAAEQRRRAGHRARVQRLLRHQVRPRGLVGDAGLGGRTVRRDGADRRARARSAPGCSRPGAAYASAEMPEYAETVGPTRDVRELAATARQPGDPAKAAAAIRTALDDAQPPLRLPLGDDAVGSILARLTGIETEVQKWTPLTRHTAFPE